MALEESEEKTQETQVTQEGDKQIVREKTSTESSAENRATVVNGVWLVLGILETVLIFRFALKLFGANPNSGFVDFVYAVSGIFVAPFSGIFSTPTTEGDIVTSVFETSTLVAMIVYAVIAWGIVKLLSLNQTD